MTLIFSLVVAITFANHRRVFATSEQLLPKVGFKAVGIGGAKK